MRNWRELLKSLSHTPRGYAADGRRLGLALDVAMEKQRQDTAVKVEEYLRHSEPKVTTSA